MIDLADYLSACRTRLRRRFVARGAALIALIALMLTGLFALVFVNWVPGSGFVLATQIGLYFALALGLAALIWWPLDSDAVARQVEARVRVFDGRLQTWWDATRRGEASAMLGLLTRQTQAIADANPQEQVVGMREFAVPSGIAVAGAVALAILLGSGDSPWQLAAKRLWAGELLTATAPRITVDPGDVVVPRGADVVVEAAASGFVARRMQMNAAFEHTDGWETAPMARLTEDQYGFVFVAVSERVEYYIEAAGLNSERYVIHVADLPRVTDVSLVYDFPEWTGLPVTTDQDGDVTALPGTRVAITAVTDLPVEDPVIVVNGASIPASSRALVTQGSFDVAEAGSWHIAVRHEGTLARISDTYLINVAHDEPPEVAFSWPGHDGQATAIEEVTLRFRAEDDYGVKTLSFNYSVNASAWTEVELDADADDAEHVLYLEDFRVPDSHAEDPAGAEGRPLNPGDMISFFAEAKDHRQRARTALYFVDVRPFDRTFREAQGGGNGNGNGNPGLEIAERQREILTATWNLINEQTDAPNNTREQGDALHDQADVLAMLQRTLKGQVDTLTARAQARRLDTIDEIDVFMSELTLAAEFMEPAAVMLDTRELEAAVTPEQQALQHLLAAEASMTDVDVSRSRGRGRGTSGRQLSELFDLEMDPERNRYETPQSPSFEDQAEQDDSDWRRLEELAARQQQLAERQSRGEESLASRWEQQRLKREIEELRQRLENQGGGSSEALANAIADLDEARQAIDRSLNEPGGDPSSARGAIEAMRRAAQQLRENQRGNLEERLARTGRQVDNLVNDQRTIIDRLDRLEREILESGGNPFRDFTMEGYADRKRRMGDDLANVVRDLNEVGEALGDADAQRVLRNAMGELEEERIDERLAYSADAFELGRPLITIGNEAIVKRALERLANRVRQAQRLVASSVAQQPGDTPLAEVRALREALAGAGAAGGVLNDSRLNGIVRATDALEFRLGEGLGQNLNLDTTLSRAAYVALGTDDANTEALAQLTRDRLDIIESALLAGDAPRIRAQKPRDTARDSEAAARYFRSLSTPE